MVLSISDLSTNFSYSTVTDFAKLRFIKSSKEPKTFVFQY